MSSPSTTNLLTVVSDKIVRAFNRSGATRAVTLDISEAFDRFLHSRLLHKLFCLLLFFFYHNKIHPVTNYKAIKNKINKTR